MKGAYEQILGKTIQSVICRENDSRPHKQIFLFFDDKTYFEIYVSDMYCPLAATQGVDPGEIEDFLQHGSSEGQSVFIKPES